MRNAFLLAAIFACAFAFAGENDGVELPPSELLERCRAMLPRDNVTVRGSIVRRSRKGIVKNDYDYSYALNQGKDGVSFDISLYDKGTTNLVERRMIVRPGEIPDGRIQKSDITWADLLLDVISWNDASYDEDKYAKSVQNQDCIVLVLKPKKVLNGVTSAKVWIDRKNFTPMQMELYSNGNLVKRIWGTRVKKFGDKWSVGTLEVEEIGTRHRTKITVDSIESK